MSIPVCFGVRTVLVTMAKLLLGFAATAFAAEATTTPPATFEASILFHREPVETGMTFERTAVEPVEVTVEGKTGWAWRARQGSDVEGWGRAFRVKVTDPRFASGRQPAVDLELTYRITADVEVGIQGDAADGPRRLGSRFGRTAAWRTIRMRADDAFFGGRLPGGFDLRIYGANADLEVQSVRLIGHDLDERPDFARLLRLDPVEADTPAGLLLFPAGAPRWMTFPFVNLARRDVTATWTLTVADRAGKQIDRHGGTFEVKGAGRRELRQKISTEGLPLGPYSATISVTVPDGSGGARTVVEREVYLGIASDTTIGKAREGEFLYGLDVSLGSPIRSPQLMEWTRAMGVDVIRGAGNSDRPGDVEATLDAYDRYDVRGLMMIDPPKQASAAERAAALPAKLARVEEVARNTAGRIRFWELGNEPDLTFFYPGPIEEYADAYHQMYDAVKRGAPGAIVMNGGLCFAGPEATVRARRFAELVDPSRLDAWAYHGHGPGAGSERAALERMRRVAGEFGKAEKPYVETESGVAARTRAQEDMQARTCVQKMVFAQSQGIPLFVWFRLLMFEEDYGNLAAEREPRPAVMAYRAMVESLRGHRFHHSLDAAALPPDVQAHVFHATDPADPRRVVVLWSDRPATASVYLDLGGVSAATDLHVRDLYGNRGVADVLPGGAVRVDAGESPVFVVWRVAGEAAASRDVAIAEPPIRVPPKVEVAPGGVATLSVRVHNPTDAAVAWTLTADAYGGAGVEPTTQPVALAAGESREVPLALRGGRIDEGVVWPKTWVVFAGIDEKAVDLTAIRSVPESLPGPGDAVRPRRVSPAEHRIDFEKAGGKLRERAAGVAFAEVIAAADTTVTVGASADWWMAWHVNGQPVYDTLAHGNGGGYGIADHTFKLPLRKGRNLLAVKVLSGSHGWKLLVGDPGSVARLADPNRVTGDGVTLALRDAAGRTLVAERIEVACREPVPTLAPLAWEPPAPLPAWEATDPLAVLGDASVTNFHVKQPDSTHWWKGEEDLSAVAWMRADDEHVYLVVKATDDAHRAHPRPERTWDGDSLQCAFSRDGRGAFDEYAVALVDGRTRLFKHRASDGHAPVGPVEAVGGEIDARVERHEAAGDAAAYTLYRISIDRKAIGPDGCLFNLLVNDDDEGGRRKQFAAWRPGLGEGKDSSAWARVTLPERSRRHRRRVRRRPRCSRSTSSCEFHP